MHNGMMKVSDNLQYSGKILFHGLWPEKCQARFSANTTSSMRACYLSMLIVVFDIKGLPNLVITPITLLGNITVPAALLIIGTSMVQMDLRRIFSGKLVWGISILRLLVLPIVIYSCQKTLGTTLELHY